MEVETISDIFKDDTFERNEVEYNENRPIPTDLTNRTRFFDTLPYKVGNRSRFLDMAPLYDEPFVYDWNDPENDPALPEWYCVIAKDAPGKFADTRLPHLDGHLAWARASWRNVDQPARVKWDKTLYAEDFQSTCGNVYFLQAKDEAAARAFVAQDPYQGAGLYASQELFRWLPKYNHEFQNNRDCAPHLVAVRFAAAALGAVRRDGLHARHVKYYERLEKVVMAGPLVALGAGRPQDMQVVGYILELSVEDKEEVLEIVNGDPYAQKDMYESVEVIPCLDLDVSGMWALPSCRPMIGMPDPPVTARMREWGLLDRAHDFHDLASDAGGLGAGSMGLTELDEQRIDEEEASERRKAAVINYGVEGKTGPV